MASVWRRLSLAACAIALLAASLAPLVSASEPKNIQVSLRAKWPATPLSLEAAEFFAQRSPRHFFDFVRGAAAALNGAPTEQQQYNAVLSASVPLLGGGKESVTLEVLKMALAIHFHSPRVEFFRNLLGNHLIEVRARCCCCRGNGDAWRWCWQCCRYWRWPSLGLASGDW